MNRPLLYQINTRVLLTKIGATLGRPATLDDVPNGFLDELAAMKFSWLWFLGVWQTGEEGRSEARSRAHSKGDFTKVLPDQSEDDICSSPFAVQSYDVNRDFGGDPALARLRERLQRRNMGLMLDFVPNHVALDHPWVYERPEILMPGTEEDWNREPLNFVRLQTARGERILAHGRDLGLPGWTDTVQLNYRHADCRRLVAREFERVAERCDGLRCDMPGLTLPAMIIRTWGNRSLPSDGSPPDDTPFWPIVLARVRERRPGFMFITQGERGLSVALQVAGFDFTYDERLYDRLSMGVARQVREYLTADVHFQRHCLRFLENHDTARAAAVFEGFRHRAAAVITYMAPGMRLFHMGQFEGRRIHVPMQLSRAPDEPRDPAIHDLYLRLLRCICRPEVQSGEWRPATCMPAGQGNGAWEQIIGFSWTHEGSALLVYVNYGPLRAQCYAPLQLSNLSGKHFDLVDSLSDTFCFYDGDALMKEGLYLDMPPWGAHVFSLRERRAGVPAAQNSARN